MKHRLLRFRVAQTVLAVVMPWSLQSRGADAELAREGISKVKAVCRSLIGIEAWRAKGIFERRLGRYVRSKQALEQSGIVDCSFHCGGTLALRGDADIYYGFPNQAIRAPRRIDTVVLHIHGNRVLAIGPGTEYYPYPYYEVEHKNGR
jgi:hypothetical protein